MFLFLAAAFPFGAAEDFGAPFGTAAPLEVDEALADAALAAAFLARWLCRFVPFSLGESSFGLAFGKDDLKECSILL